MDYPLKICDILKVKSIRLIDQSEKSFLYDLESCFGGLPEPVSEEEYGNCQTQAANSSFTPDCGGCAPENQEGRPYDECFWIVEMSNLRSTYCSPENKEPVVIGENAFPSDVVTATDAYVATEVMIDNKFNEAIAEYDKHYWLINLAKIVELVSYKEGP